MKQWKASNPCNLKFEATRTRESNSVQLHTKCVCERERERERERKGAYQNGVVL